MFAPGAGAHAAGYSLLELTFTLGLAVTVTAAAVPQVLTTVDDVRAAGAARHVGARLQRARMDALVRSADVALRFTQAQGTYSFTPFVDGNGNGVRSRDIQRGVDRPIGAAESLSDHFPGVDFGVVPGAPSVDGASPPPGTDPLKLGTGDILTFTPAGTSSSGSLYIRGRRGLQYVVRVFGDTGRVRVLKLDARRREWNPI